jgi:hypothetical protein
MKVIYSPKIRQEEGNLALLEQATSRLKEILGPTADLAEIEWDRTEDDRGRPFYTLTLRDLRDQAQADFSLEELKSAPYMRVRLYRLWGDLLQLRSDEQHRKVLELVAQLDED